MRPSIRTHSSFFWVRNISRKWHHLKFTCNVLHLLTFWKWASSGSLSIKCKCGLIAMGLTGELVIICNPCTSFMRSLRNALPHSDWKNSLTRKTIGQEKLQFLTPLTHSLGQSLMAGRTYVGVPTGRMSIYLCTYTYMATCYQINSLASLRTDRK